MELDVPSRGVEAVVVRVPASVARLVAVPLVGAVPPAAATVAAEASGAGVAPPVLENRSSSQDSCSTVNSCSLTPPLSVLLLGEDILSDSQQGL